MKTDMKIHDDKRAIDAKETMKKAKRAALWRILGQLLAFLVLLVIVVFMWRCLSGILDYSGESEVPQTREAPPVR
jgi:flagellar biosynthesis/type III secretory pathway M-ring protein FliF/YscJ